MKYSVDYRRNLIKYWNQFIPNWSIPKGYHVHHIKPKSCGGSNHPKNLIALHKDDHISIHKCRGDKITDNYIKIIGHKHNDKTKDKIRKSNIGKQYKKETIKRMSKSKKGENHPRFNGYYITPFGKFSNSIEIREKTGMSFNTIIKWCKNSSNKISTMSYVQNIYLQSLGNKNEIINKTFKEIGFGFEHK